MHFSCVSHAFPMSLGDLQEGIDGVIDAASQHSTEGVQLGEVLILHLSAVPLSIGKNGKIGYETVSKGRYEYIFI